MNRYIVAGLCHDAIAGKRVIVYSASHLEARYLFRDCADYLTDLGMHDRINVRNGAEYITTHSGGRLDFTSDLRGKSPDVLFLIDSPDVGTMDYVRAAGATAEVIRA